LVGGVVGQEVAEVDETEARRRPGERRAPSARDTHVLRRVLRREPSPVGPVVVGGDCLAQLPQPCNRRVLLIRRIHRDRVNARWRSGELAGLGLTLAEVAPVGAGRIEAALLGLGGDEDDAGTGNRTERLGGALAGHGLPRLYTPGAMLVQLAF